MDVKCINAQPFDSERIHPPDLIEGNLYMVLGIEGEYYRLFGVTGHPYLYHNSRFEVANPEEESDWIAKTCKDGIEKIYPPQLHNDGFFESYFDKGKEEWMILFRYANRIKSRRMDKIVDEELIMKAREWLPY